MLQQFYPMLLLHMLDNEFNVPIDWKAHAGNFETMFKNQKMARKVCERRGWKEQRGSREAKAERKAEVGMGGWEGRPAHWYIDFGIKDS
jgi:hypothetical protein